MSKEAEVDITVPMPVAYWFANPDLAKALRELVRQPLLQKAIAVLKEAAQPSMHGMLESGDDRAARYMWLAGYMDAFKDLDKLTKPDPSKDQMAKDTPEPWSHISAPFRGPTPTETAS